MDNKADSANPLKEHRSRRNKHKVRYDLLDAVGKTLREYGFANLGINLVAEIAGTDKNSIYRNFGSFDELLNQYIEKQDFWFKSLSLIKDIQIADHKNFMKQILSAQFETINNNKEIQQLLIWELGELSQRTKSVAQRREELYEFVIKQYESYFSNSPLDINVIAAILVAGVYYLILHKEHSTFCLVNCKLEKDRILNGINQFIDVIFQSVENLKTQERIAINALKKGLDIHTVSEITELPLAQIENLKSGLNKT